MQHLSVFTSLNKDNFWNKFKEITKIYLSHNFIKNIQGLFFMFIIFFIAKQFIYVWYTYH
jgi:hypothetical protein